VFGGSFHQGIWFGHGPDPRGHDGRNVAPRAMEGSCRSTALRDLIRALRLVVAAANTTTLKQDLHGPASFGNELDRSWWCWPAWRGSFSHDPLRSDS